MVSLAFLMNWGYNQLKTPCIFDKLGIKSDKIARGKPCIFDEIGLKSDEVARKTDSGSN